MSFNIFGTKHNAVIFVMFSANMVFREYIAWLKKKKVQWGR
jgi:hypothetical protein